MVRGSFSLKRSSSSECSRKSKFSNVTILHKQTGGKNRVRNYDMCYKLDLQSIYLLDLQSICPQFPDDQLDGNSAKHSHPRPAIFPKHCTLSFPVNRSAFPRQVQSNQTTKQLILSLKAERNQNYRASIKVVLLVLKIGTVTKLKINIFEGKGIC